MLMCWRSARPPSGLPALARSSSRLGKNVELKDLKPGVKIVVNEGVVASSVEIDTSRPKERGPILQEFWHNFTHNLFKPLLLFFYLGFLVPILKVEFEFPYVIYQGLTIYLLLAIGWQALLAPARTPPQVLQKLRTAARSVVDKKDWTDFMAERGAVAKWASPETVTQRIKDESAVWGEVIRTAGITAD